MSIPDYESLMLPLLQIAAKANGNEVQLAASIEQLADDYKLIEEERKELLPSGATFRQGSTVSILPCVKNYKIKRSSTDKEP